MEFQYYDIKIMDKNDKIFSTDEIEELFDDISCGLHNYLEKRTLLFKIILEEKFDEKFIFDSMHMEIITKLPNFYSEKLSDFLSCLLKNNKIKNIDDCFDMFIKQSNFISLPTYNATHIEICRTVIFFLENINIISPLHMKNIVYITSKIYYVYNNIYHDAMMDKISEKFQSHHATYELYDNIMIISNEHFRTKWITMFFEKTPPSIYYLYTASLYQHANVIQYLLNEKIIPTKKCYRALILKKQMANVSHIVDLFIDHGYNLSDSDIIFAAKHRITLSINYFTEQFVPTAEFYSYCDKSYRPCYNNKMYNDKLWFYRLLEISQKKGDQNEINKLCNNLKLEYDQTAYSKLALNAYSYRISSFLKGCEPDKLKKARGW